MYVSDVPQEVKDELVHTISHILKKEVGEVAIFVRFNNEDMDTSFRIHSDREVFGVQPTIAAVLYLNDGNTGTALFDHPVYGQEPINDEAPIHVEDDGEWIVTDYCPQVANTLFVYDARRFHSRWPCKADAPRFTVTLFLKEHEDDESFNT